MGGSSTVKTWYRVWFDDPDNDECEWVVWCDYERKEDADKVSANLNYSFVEEIHE